MQKFPGKEDLIKFLGNVSLFKNAGAEILSHLAGKTIIDSYVSGSPVINKGDVGETMYLIFSGRLKVHDGEHQVAELGENQFFGELSLLDSEPRSMSVTTLDPAVLGSINRNDFYEVLQQFPAITKDIIAVLNNRLRGQNSVLISEFKNREEQLQELVKIRTKELEEKNHQLELTLDKLTKSQQQLIQSEKLASLGQLIAGIAHEIQNPLNFVNNFAILSNDLINEIAEAATEEIRNEVIGDIKNNLVKISEHGGRAGSIVKNMLEHSRTGSGTKQLTDIGRLCLEYLNLSYHGVLANNAEFNCTLVKNVAADIPEVNVVAQDFSRVLINIYNNAFYAAKEKGHKLKAADPASTYLAEVSLGMAVNNGNVEIKIRDNGMGIPDKIKEKIFQPFFTTKPTGQGTGLGLSLSHDIIKAHGGEIKVESEEGHFTEFTITIPL